MSGLLYKHINNQIKRLLTLIPSHRINKAKSKISESINKALESLGLQELQGNESEQLRILAGDLDAIDSRRQRFLNAGFAGNSTEIFTDDNGNITSIGGVKSYNGDINDLDPMDQSRVISPENLRAKLIPKNTEIVEEDPKLNDQIAEDIFRPSGKSTINKDGSYTLYDMYGNSINGNVYTDNRDQMKALQQFLYDQGYNTLGTHRYGGNTGIDGYWGKDTLDTLQNWANKQGIEGADQLKENKISITPPPPNDPPLYDSRYINGNINLDYNNLSSSMGLGDKVYIKGSDIYYKHDDGNDYVLRTSLKMKDGTTKPGYYFTAENGKIYNIYVPQNNSKKLTNTSVNTPELNTVEITNNQPLFGIPGQTPTFNRQNTPIYYKP